MGNCSGKSRNNNVDLELSGSPSTGGDLSLAHAQEDIKALEGARGTTNILKQLDVILKSVSESREKLYAFERAGCKGLVQVVNKNRANAEIVVVAFRILCELAASLAAKRTLCIAGVCDEVVTILKTYPSDKNIATLGCRLISLLCFDVQCVKHLTELSASDVVSKLAPTSATKDDASSTWKKHALDSLATFKSAKSTA